MFRLLVGRHKLIMRSQIHTCLYEQVGDPTMTHRHFCLPATLMALSLVRAVVAAEDTKWYLKPDPAALQEWRDAKFGVFICW